MMAVGLSYLALCQEENLVDVVSLMLPMTDW